MAKKYLDNAGLDHMWDKIKSYLTSNYAAKSHTHTIAQITNLQTTLNGKANSSHTHTASQITDLKSNSIRPLNTAGTSRALPAINIGEMKAISASTADSSGSYITLPSGGTYLCLSVGATVNIITRFVFGGIQPGGARIGQAYQVNASTYSETSYRGFYIRLS